MVENDIRQYFSNQDLLKELDEGSNYRKIVCTEILLGFVTLAVRFMDETAYLNADGCARHDYDDKQLRRYRWLVVYVIILIVLHIV
jgi:hypothetical protein